MGGIILYKLGVRFNSPTINLKFTESDFIKFCENLKYYLSLEIKEYYQDGINYPVGTLGEGNEKIIIYFQHYETFTQAKSKWDERKTRINWDNLYFIMSDGKNCDDVIVKKFDSLPYEHKAFLTYRDLDGIKSAVKFEPIRVKEGNTYKFIQPAIFERKSRFSGKRIVDDWDYIKFLNS